MKKVVVGLVAVMAALMMCICFAGCGNGLSSLQKKYEDAGYTCEIKKASDDKIKEMEDEIKELDGDEKKEAQKELDLAKKTEVLYISKSKVPVAMITYVPNIDDWKEVVGETVWKAAENAEYIKGKLIFSPIADLSGDAFKIFKDNAK